MTVNGVPTHELQSWRRTTSCRKDIETLSPLMDDRCLDLEDKFSDSSVTHRLVPGAEDELDAKSEMQEEQEPCSNERISALSAVSFVIALVAGGIFSLDIFEAFPIFDCRAGGGRGRNSWSHLLGWRKEATLAKTPESRVFVWVHHSIGGRNMRLSSNSTFSDVAPPEKTWSTSGR
eukprot:CAMPEP_0194517452 /NCGR_PEP_ID=MMETSP0253-20130528/50623_1 /TAXON_ID=2966 /ORGANISM="Noctiluca scintillans" /LENGTH=175 /DNA_ID=CAMNT_0039361415 /DNA_START=207 /DNA_END=732 /DNA_ORIENTATION=-